MTYQPRSESTKNFPHYSIENKFAVLENFSTLENLAAATIKLLKNGVSFAVARKFERDRNQSAVVFQLLGG